MKILSLALSLVVSLPSFAANLVSTVAGLTIANAHELEAGRIYRGAQPGKKTTELKALGVSDVIIFKTQSTTEVDKEILSLTELGIQIHHIPFRWKDLESPAQSCEQLIQALQILKANREAGKVSFFHCTVGEDRTGLLAGMWRMLDDGATRDEVWKNEMCAHGYADGNYAKPKEVAAAVHAGLTPLFFALSSKIAKGELTLDTLDAKVCQSLVIRKQKRVCRP